MEKELAIVTYKWGSQLSDEEITQINKAKQRVWNIPPMDAEHKDKYIWFLVKDISGKILSQGQLFPLSNVEFMGQTYAVCEIGGIIANVKKEGYGTKVLEGIKEFLEEKSATGIGFTSNSLSEFYKKCGFSISTEALNQFVNYEEFTGEKEECVFYFDSEEEFMKKVLSHSTENIHLK